MQRLLHLLEDRSKHHLSGENGIPMCTRSNVMSITSPSKGLVRLGSHLDERAQENKALISQLGGNEFCKAVAGRDKQKPP